MAKREKPQPDMELSTLKSEISTLNKRMEEVITILGGNSSYRVKGIIAEFSETQKDIVQIKLDIAEIKQQEKERWLFSIKTVPSKIVAVVTAIALLLSVIQNLKQLFVK